MSIHATYRRGRWLLVGTSWTHRAHPIHRLINLNQLQLNQSPAVPGRPRASHVVRLGPRASQGVPGRPRASQGVPGRPRARSPARPLSSGPVVNRCGLGS